MELYLIPVRASTAAEVWGRESKGRGGLKKKKYVCRLFFFFFFDSAPARFDRQHLCPCEDGARASG